MVFCSRTTQAAHFASDSLSLLLVFLKEQHLDKVLEICSNFNCSSTSRHCEDTLFSSALPVTKLSGNATKRVSCCVNIIISWLGLALAKNNPIIGSRSIHNESKWIYDHSSTYCTFGHHNWISSIQSITTWFNGVVQRKLCRKPWISPTRGSWFFRQMFPMTFHLQPSLGMIGKQWAQPTHLPSHQTLHQSSLNNVKP